jgi:hypothetical protein
MFRNSKDIYGDGHGFRNTWTRPRKTQKELEMDLLEKNFQNGVISEQQYDEELAQLMKE